MHYESGYAYPLIVWLHGPGSNEEELPQVMPLISTRNHIAIAPRGTSSAGARRAQDNGPACTWEETTAGISEASERVEHCIALARQRYNVHPERIFIAGYSAGGTMAHRLAMQSPERFAGAISLGGQVPRGSHLLKHINRARQLPLLLSASPTAEKYPTEQVMADLRFLHCAGLTLSLRLYPEGDDLTTVMFQDLNTWVMEQFCTPSATASS
jgi:phospholipase/carboxylesterase